MARKYVNPNRSSTVVTDRLLVEARARAEAAAGRLREAEHADPMVPSWDAEYTAASAAAAAAARRIEALEQLRAAQVERGGKRDAAVKAAAADLKAASTALAASRDQVAAAADGHLRALAVLATAAAAHNDLLAKARAQVAERGLRVRDDLVDENSEHAEGVLDLGVRAGGVDWTVIPAGGVVCHALRQVFGEFPAGDPLSAIGKYTFRPHEVQSRADGLRVPSLKDAGATVPPGPQRPQIARLTADYLRPPPGPVGSETDAQARKRMGLPARNGSRG